jgi:cell division protein FtsB
MRDPFTMVVLIILIITVGNIIRAKMGLGRVRDGRRDGRDAINEDRENARLQDEVKQLKDRIAVLERITVDKENSLERQIEQLRDR